MSSIPQIVLPCIGKEIIIKKSSREFRVFSINEQKQLCTYLCKHMSYKNMGILICLYTGLRIGEICALREGVKILVSMESKSL